MSMVTRLGTPAMKMESIAVSSTPLTFTSTNYRRQVGPTASDLLSANSAFVSVETNSVRFDFTGEDATTGHLFTAGSSFIIEGAGNIAKTKFVRASADGTVRVTYYG